MLKSNIQNSNVDSYDMHAVVWYGERPFGYLRACVQKEFNDTNCGQ